MPSSDLFTILAGDVVRVYSMSARALALATIVGRQLVNDIAERWMVGAAPANCRSLRHLDLFLSEIF